VAEAFNNLDAKIVALLHDVVEDTKYSLKDIHEELDVSEFVLKAIDAITHRKNESNKKYIARVRIHPLARAVKIVDIRDNLGPSRMGRLDKATQDRLKKKYKRALDVLL
jgi:(p)ppGpp synthase/HD superfamily hydrolase